MSSDGDGATVQVPLAPSEAQNASKNCSVGQQEIQRLQIGHMANRLVGRSWSQLANQTDASTPASWQERDTDVERRLAYLVVGTNA